MDISVTHPLPCTSDAPRNSFGLSPQRMPAQPLPMHSSAEFAMVVDRALADCRRRRTRLAVLMVKVSEVGLTDEAGQIGHEAPPKLAHTLLDKLALRLQRLVRATDQVVRIDSRHIGVVLADSAAAEACLVDGRAHRALAGPYSVEDQIMAVRLSVGRAAYPEDGVTGRELVRAAGRVPLSLAGSPSGDSPASSS